MSSLPVGLAVHWVMRLMRSVNIHVHVHSVMVDTGMYNLPVILCG